MKKVFGILFLIIGLITVSIGVGGLSYTIALENCIDKQIENEFATIN